MNISYDCQVLTRNYIQGNENKFKTYKLLNRNIHCFPPGVMFTICRDPLILVSICPESTFEKTKECVRKTCKILGVNMPGEEQMETLYCSACERGYRPYDVCRGEWFGTESSPKVMFVFQPNYFDK